MGGQVVGDGDVFCPLGIEQQGANLALHEGGGFRLPEAFARQGVALGGNVALRGGLPHEVGEVAGVYACLLAEVLFEQVG